MPEAETYLVDGKCLRPDDVRALFVDAPLPERQGKVLDRIEGTVVVDIGCFVGSFVAEASRRYPDRAVIGIDYLHDNLRIAQMLHPEIRDRFRRMSVYHLDFADASVDCVTFQEVLEHLEGAALAIKEVNRVLRSGGVLIVSVPNPYYAGRLARFCRSETANSFRRWRSHAVQLRPEVFDPSAEWDRHVFTWTPETLLALLTENGFDYVEHVYENGMPDPFRRAILTLIPFLGPTLILKVRKVAAARPQLV